MHLRKLLEVGLCEIAPIPEPKTGYLDLLNVHNVDPANVQDIEQQRPDETRCSMPAR